MAASVIAPLNRKTVSLSGAGADPNLARVYPLSIVLWKTARSKSRLDSFIGVTSVVTGIFYMAPCFAISATETRATKDRSKLECYGCDLKDKLKATSVVEIESVYGGKDSVVLVELNDDDYKNRNFDGHSHPALLRWLNARDPTISLDKKDYLGWSLQPEGTGYVIRFASGMNRTDKTTARFTPRKTNKHASEPRDMPKYWANWCENTLARELHLALHERPEGNWERFKTREGNTKIAKFDYTPDSFKTWPLKSNKILH